MKRGGSLLGYWYGAVCIVGLGFGLLGERRPFGQSILAHPFIVYAFVVATSLLVFRVARQRPVPELIPERALGLGCGCCSVSRRELHRCSRGRSLTKRLRRRRVHARS